MANYLTNIGIFIPDDPKLDLASTLRELPVLPLFDPTWHKLSGDCFPFILKFQTASEPLEKHQYEQLSKYFLAFNLDNQLWLYINPYDDSTYIIQ